MRTSLFLLSYLIMLPLVIAAPGAHGPNGEHLSTDERTVGELGRQADGSVILPMPHQAMLEIRTRLVAPSNVNATVRMSAVVRPHPEGHAVIQPSSDGRFEASETGVPGSGEKVSAGQVLGYIRYQDTAYELASQNSELKVVRNQIDQAKRDVKRLESLGELASKQELDQLQTRLKNLTEQEAALQQGLEKPEVLTAPIDGILINNGLRNGQWVQAGTSVLEVVSPALRQIDAVTADTGYLSQFSEASLMEYGGITLHYRGYSPRLSGGLASLYFEYKATDNAAVDLLLDQPVTLVASVESQISGIVLPAQALVTNSANLPIVWIKVSAERFLPQVVQYEALDAENIVITDGLGADNRVVVNGTALLNQVR